MPPLNCLQSFALYDTVTLTSDLLTPNHTACRLSQGRPLYQVEHFGIIRFLVIVRTDIHVDRVRFRPEARAEENVEEVIATPRLLVLRARCELSSGGVRG